MSLEITSESTFEKQQRGHLQTAKVSLPKAVQPACEHLRAGTESPSVLSIVPHLSQEIPKSFLRRLSLVRKIAASRKSAKLGIKTQKYHQPFHKLLTTSGLSSTQWGKYLLEGVL